MKTFYDLTKEEKVSLTTEQVQYYARLDCANQGIIIPQKPISETKPVIEPTTKFYSVGYESVYFDNEAAVEAYIALLAHSYIVKGMTNDYSSKSQYGVKRDTTNSEPKITLLYTTEEAKEIKDVLISNTQTKKEWNEYNEALKEYNNIVDSMWEEVRDINYVNSRKEYYNKVYNDYLELAEGNNKTAYTFFSKAYATLSLSDVDREIVDSILSAPTCEETLIA